MRRAFAALVPLLLAPAALAQSLNPAFPGFNGPITASAVSGNTVYVAGGFTYAGPATGPGVPIDVTTVVTPATTARIEGIVYASVPDGTGGWYLGGAFTKVGGVSRANVAHIHSDGALDNSWSPAPDGAVRALAIAGGLVYLGGDFQNVGASLRLRAAAVDATTGAVAAWNPVISGPGATVRALAVAGSRAFLGGTFSAVNNGSGLTGRQNLAAVDATTGAVLPWAANSPSVVVNALAVNGNVLYVGAGNTSANSGYVAAYNATTAAGLQWQPTVNGPVNAVAVDDVTIYVGGAFTQVNSQPRNGGAALDATTAGLTAWNPGSSGMVINAIAPDPFSVYVGGTFTTAGGQKRANVAATDPATGVAKSWNPGTSSVVYTLSRTGNAIYVGGDFVSANGFVRNGLAGFDATTGAVLPWNPGTTSGSVEAMLVTGGSVYCGGSFTTLGGGLRSNLGSLDGTSGALTAWNPGANGAIHALATDGSLIYAGGDFIALGGVVRNGAGAVPVGSNSATAWNPDLSWLGTNGVNAIALSGSLAYLGGNFGGVGGSTRTRLAAVDLATGAPQAWNPAANATVRTLALVGGTLFVGGDFTIVRGQPRNSLAAVDGVTGALSSWDPNADGNVTSLVPSSGTFFVTGSFNTIGGQPRALLAQIDQSTGLAFSWQPNPNASVATVRVASGTVFAGGSFTVAEGKRVDSLAGFSLAALLSTPPLATRVGIDLAAAPVPSRGPVTLRFTLPAATDADVRVLDVGGREVARLAQGTLPAGPQQLEWDGQTRNGRALPGVYLVELRTAGGVSGRRVILAR